MHEKILTAIATVVAIIPVGFGAWYYASSGPTNSGTTEPITIGNMNIYGSALIYIAEDQGFFAKNGLNVKISNYGTGLAAVNGLLNNEVDLATATEYSLIGKAFKGEKSA